MYGFCFVIFLDFSAYSDIARGCGRLLGLELPVNFDAPYLAGGPSEFWRRWHISLSSWLRDYLYVGLGGNRAGRTRTLVNLIVTMLLGGLWHGASWRFVVWGALHGLLLVVYRLAGDRTSASARSRPVVRLARVALFIHLVCLTWIFFRAQDVQGAWLYLTRMLAFAPGAGAAAFSTGLWYILVAALLHVAVEPRLEAISRWTEGLPAALLAAGTLAAFTFVSYTGYDDAAHRAFIYFRF